ncbi:MAG: helix-turn-helix domain-containing protein [Planctomycetota bacterium]|jgi:AraC-like DNA-binding protein
MELNQQIANPAGLSERQIADLRLLSRARIEVFSAIHHVHRGLRPLISNGRVLQDTFLYMPLKGRIELTCEGKRYGVRPGQCMLISAGQAHGTRNRCCCLEVAGVHAHIHLEEGLPDQRLFDLPVHELKQGDFWQAQIELLISLSTESGFNHTAGEIFRHLLMDLVCQGAELKPQKRSIDPRIREAVSLMQKHFVDPLPLAVLGNRVGLGSSQFRLLFRREMGTAPKDYQRSLRLEAAIRLLRRRDLSIKQITTQLGYANTQHLVKHFRQILGMTPGAYRKELGG